MTVSRRELIAYGTAGALTTLTRGRNTFGEEASQQEMPNQVASDRVPASAADAIDSYDMRNGLTPRRLTMAMWDTAYALRHQPGGGFANYDRVLDEAVERGFNTLRIDPMPQWIDLSKPDRILEWPDPHQPFMPWGWNTAVKGPVGMWVIDFIQKLNKRPSLQYTLSGWWLMQGPGHPHVPPGPPPLRKPADMVEGAEMWATTLTNWKQRFGFDRILYVDIANETPYFFPGFREQIKSATGKGFNDLPVFSAEQSAFMANEINKALALLRREFPELRFTTSIHGDLRWLDVPLELDCLDVHFYADADPRWTKRTRFDEFAADGLFIKDSWFKEFSERCTKTAAAMAPMLRACQRFKMKEFAGWAARRGAPLTTSEAWASWFYIDNPQLDWGWLLDWAAWSVEDAIAYQFWGWTPCNYVQPQFKIWKNVEWLRSLNERFLSS
jgi:hypothetical protein